MRATFFSLMIFATLVGGCSREPQPDSIQMTNGQGEIAGEVTADSVILHSRLTTEAVVVDGDVPGVPGVARFEVADSTSSANVLESPWLEATSDHDYIVQARIAGLRAGSRYSYRLRYGPDRTNTRLGPVRTFKTLPGADAATEVNFVVVTGMNYARFYGDNPRAGSPEDKLLGYPALKSILDREPEFFVATGDNVYYDVPFEQAARTRSQLRQKWHEQLVQPRFIDLFAAVPTYWEKDDHDYRYNDSDNAIGLEPSPELGRSTFHEQVPVVDPTDPDPVTYRTHRVSRDLQIWLTEGRDYRSPHMMPQGPEKTLWGTEQIAWLKRTLLESDATFKILISPTPMIGPDDANQAGRAAEGHDLLKRDNHSNPEGFQHERDAFFDWLEENSFLNSHFYFVVGDRHWQYHSIHPRGFEEFSTGALIDANSRLGRNPGDPDSNDPDALIEQPYTSRVASGGFFEVTVTPGSQPVAAFRWFDELGKLTHELIRTATD